ncbi:MAG: hypothetical protein AAF645_20065, partial [Myxococcota bacterium]
MTACARRPLPTELADAPGITYRSYNHLLQRASSELECDWRKVEAAFIASRTRRVHVYAASGCGRVRHFLRVGDAIRS